MIGRLELGASACAVLLLATACTANQRAAPAPSLAHTTAAATGLIDGQGSPCSGPAALPPHFIVPVTLTSAANEARRVTKLEAPYRFTFVVSPGTYTLSEPEARPVTVQARAGSTIHVQLIAGCL